MINKHLSLYFLNFIGFVFTAISFVVSLIVLINNSHNFGTDQEWRFIFSMVSCVIFGSIFLIHLLVILGMLFYNFFLKHSKV